MKENESGQLRDQTRSWNKKQTFFFISTLPRDKVPATTAYRTSLSYGKSSVAVKVDKESRRRGVARLNCLQDLYAREKKMTIWIFTECQG